MSSQKGADVCAIRLLGNIRIKGVIDAELEARRKKYRLDAEQVVEHLGKIIAVDPRSYVDANGETLPLNRLTEAQAQAISSFETETFVDKDGQARVRTRVKLNDRNVALGTLNKILGLQTDRLRLEGSIEHVIRQMTPEERIERVRQLLEKAEREYLPAYRAMMVANGSPVIDETAVHGAAAAADDQPVVGTPAAQPEPSAGLGSELPVNGGGHVDQARRAAREEILGPVDADQTSGWQMWPGHDTRR